MKHKHQRFPSLPAWLSGLVLALAAGQAAAAAYPVKPIRIVVPFPAGVTTDIVARTVAESMSRTLGQPMIVDNKAGADGTIGVADVARSAPDGYTLVVSANGPLSAAPHLRKTLPYDVLKLTPISDLVRATFAVYVADRVPARTLDEFVAYAQKNPGKLNYASGNLTGQLSFAYITGQKGLDMVHIPYKGETDAMNDLLGGRVEAMVATLGTGLPQVAAGKLRVLAVIAPERSAEIPDVPTISQAGFDNFPIQSWIGMFGPPGMPQAIVQQLNAAATKALEDPAVRSKLQGMRTIVSPSTPEAVAAFARFQLDAHGEVIRQAGVPMAE